MLRKVFLRLDLKLKLKSNFLRSPDKKILKSESPIISMLNFLLIKFNNSGLLFTFKNPL